MHIPHRHYNLHYQGADIEKAKAVASEQARPFEK